MQQETTLMPESAADVALAHHVNQLLSEESAREKKADAKAGGMSASEAAAGLRRLEQQGGLGLDT